MCVCVCVCVCVVGCVCVWVLFTGILSVNSISIIQRVLSEKLTVNRLVRFVLNLICVCENKMDRQSTVMRGEVAFVLL